jgi:serine protease Do
MPATPAPRNDVRASARALSAAFADVAKQASPSVVSIRVEARAQQQQLPPGLEQFFGGQQQQPGIQRGGGTGVVLRNDGHILTNNHVVENANRIDVSFQDGRTYRATLVGTDPASDLAVVKIDAKNLVAARFANSDEAEIGEWVVAIGSPFGLDYTVTTGVLSAKGRGSMGASEIGDYLQTDASINPGNSGGPLVNLDGEVLGINTFIIGRGTGIGFAIPSSIVQNVANQIVDKGVVRRAWIGVSFQEMTPELASYFGMEASRGALVSEAVPGGPAAKAGIQSGDVIMTINDRTLANSKDLQREVLRVPVGTKLHVGVLRQGKAVALTIVAGERPSSPEEVLAPSRSGRGRNAKPAPDAGSSLGLHYEPLTPMLRDRLGYNGPGGVIVSGVDNGTPADRAGIGRGDIIISADQLPVKDAAQVTRALADGKALLQIRRGTQDMYVVVKKD